MTPEKEASAGSAQVTNFIRNIVEDDIKRGVNEPRRWCGHPAPYSEQEKGAVDQAKIRTRFPPEPNGYLHIGHAKSICLNFGLAKRYGGVCHMRFDDTNPVKEDKEYVDGILDSVHWLGFDWKHGSETNLYYASSYFDYMYAFAEHLIRCGYAYVDEQSAEELHATRGTLTEPGRNSPYRDRTPEENLRLFREMRDGKHPEGSMVLRAKIDMASPNINMRDPAIYRIRFAEHHRTGKKWCIYPMYTYAHPIEDALEEITHSVCTLEFEDQRPFYNWALERIVPVLRTPQYNEALGIIRRMAAGEDGREAAFVEKAFESRDKLGCSLPESQAAEIFDAWKEKGVPESLSDEGVTKFFALLLQYPENFTPLMQSALEAVRPNFFLLPHQYEFNRLNLTYVVVSKRKLIELVRDHHVDGWDDPRMPTIVGLRRRGYTPEAIQLFAERSGVSKVAGGWIDYSVLEQALREDLEERADRRIAVLHPLKLIIDNYPEGKSETLEAANHPSHPERGTRELTFSRELWIEESDFAEVPPKGFRRLTIPADGTPAKPVRLRYAYIIVPKSVEKDASGKVVAVHAEYLPETRSGSAGADKVKAKATIHWLDAKSAVPAEVREYDRLFCVPHPDEGEGSFLDRLTPNSKRVLAAYVEPAAAAAAPDEKFQFERNGYFVADRVDHTKEKPVFNLSVTLRETKK
jgi:glutaminyl-tRNA synthetase